MTRNKAFACSAAFAAKHCHLNALVLKKEKRHANKLLLVHKYCGFIYILYKQVHMFLSHTQQVNK